MTYLEHATKDGYAYISGEEGKQRITYVTANNFSENIMTPRKKFALNLGQS